MTTIQEALHALNVTDKEEINEAVEEAKTIDSDVNESLDTNILDMTLGELKDKAEAAGYENVNDFMIEDEAAAEICAACEDYIEDNFNPEPYEALEVWDEEICPIPEFFGTVEAEDTDTLKAILDATINSLE